MYKVGEKVVYPAHGVGVVESVDNVEFAGKTFKMLIIRILENDMIIKVPVDKAEKIGVRKIIDEDKLEKVVRILKSRPQKAEKGEKVSWTVKHREYLEKIKSKDIEVVAEVYRDLMLLKREKELSFGEKRILESAQQFLASEISETKGISFKEAEEFLISMFKGEEE